jgi:hypothetical protein
MKARRIAAAAITAWLLSIPLGTFLDHGIFGSVYAANAVAFRTDPETIRRLPIAYAVQLVGFRTAPTCTPDGHRVEEAPSTAFVSPLEWTVPAEVLLMRCAGLQ